MDKQALQAAIERYAAELMETARRSRFPLEQSPTPSEPVQEPPPVSEPVPAETPEVEINPPEAGEAQDPLQNIDEEPLSYAEFLEKNQKSGDLRIQAYVGRQAMPVPDAKVEVFREFTDGPHVFATGTTDANGILDGIRLPAPDRALAESPTGEPPYSTYDIRVTHPGYRTEVYLKVPVFDGIKSIQPVRFLPDSSPS